MAIWGILLSNLPAVFILFVFAVGITVLVLWELAEYEQGVLARGVGACVGAFLLGLVPMFLMHANIEMFALPTADAIGQKTGAMDEDSISSVTGSQRSWLHFVSLVGYLIPILSGAGFGVWYGRNGESRPSRRRGNRSRDHYPEED